jgi:alanine or glycine:cation symporter, AGCS family
LQRLRRYLTYFGFLLALLGSSAWSLAQEANSAESSANNTPIVSAEESTEPKEEPMGIDARINMAFEPIAVMWENLVLTKLQEIKRDDGSVLVPGVPVVLLLLVFGAVYFTLYFGFANIRLFGLAIRVVRGKYDNVEHAGATEIKHFELHELDGDIKGTIRDEHQHGEVSHFQALATAVSGTVGLGNIAGVALAVAAGGPGATFWMIVCGLVGMSTKFVECTLGVQYRDIESDGTVHGGPMYYLSKGLASIGLVREGKVLAYVFAILCVGASFGGGNMFQANQATQQIQSMLSIDVNNGSALAASSGAIIGVLMAIVTAVVIIGGIKRIANVTDKLVPFMAILYVGAALIIILMRIQDVPAAISAIITGAFTPEAAVGSMIGVIIIGFQRAAFSNEAGAGSAAIAHSAVTTRYSASEGVVSLLEPFIDTVVICTMTAIVIVLYNIDGTFAYGAKTSLTGVDLTSRAFDSTIPNFRYVLTIAVVLFAFSTLISWSYYGLTAWKFLFGRSKASDLTYKILFCLAVVVGSASSLKAVTDFSDAMILAMIFPNMVGLFLLAPKVRELLKRYLQAIGESK